MLQPNFFNSIFVYPVLNILVGFYQLFDRFQVPGALGFSIIGLTVTVRLLLHPFFKQQMETAKKMQDIKPHLDSAQKKYKGDAKKLQEAQMKIYQEAGINPASGCLFMLIQIPIFIGLYQTLQVFLVSDMKVVVEAVNKALYFPFLHLKTIDTWFFGINLAVTPEKIKSIFVYLIPIITAALQYFQTQASTAGMAQPLSASGANDKNDKDSTSKGDDFQKAMNTQMKYIFPLMIGWFSLRMPIGLSLYWNIFSLFSIIQYEFFKKGNKKS